MASTVTLITTTMAPKTTPTPTSGVRAAHQGGILEGANPSKYDSRNPIIIFIIQAGIILVFCRLLNYPLSKIRQSKVIAEIIGGILLDPSVFGRISGFSDTIFPRESIPTLSLAANLGLVLYLFLIGLEVDLRLLLSNWRVALSVGAAGMALPFGLGCAIAYGLYHEFREDAGLVSISFGTYMLFVGVAMAITAFPVLCRILTELKLLRTQVGIVVLSAGVGNDVVGWILLALCVALVNAGTGISALYVLLTCVAWILFLVYGIRPAFVWILRRTGSIQNGPTQSMVALTVLMTLVSSFFTGIIGVHPIFGGFLIGLICPHDSGFAIKLAEKIEDLVTVLFLPLYFALSGLGTNLGLLDSGATWAYVIGVICVAFVGKFVGGTIAARLCRMVWRESFTVGVLMSCKGLVELVVLNIGLQAKILSQRTFTVFIVMALVTTFATTPLTTALYPPWYQKKIAAWKRDEIDWDGNLLDQDSQSVNTDVVSTDKQDASEVRRLLVYLRLQCLPSLFAFLSLLGADRSRGHASRVHPSKAVTNAGGQSDEPTPLLQKQPLQIHGLRILELGERLSSIMKESEIEDVPTTDLVVNSFYSFSQLNSLAVSGGVEIVPEGSYAEILSRSISQQGSDMVLLPWSENGSLSETRNTSFEHSQQRIHENGPHSQFVGAFLNRAPCHAAVFVNNGFGRPAQEEHGGSTTQSTSPLSLGGNYGLPTVTLADHSHHIFFPFFGSPDDRAAMHFVLRLAHNANVTATILFVDLDQSSSDTGNKFMPPPTDATGKNGVNVTASASQETFEQEKAFFISMKDSLSAELGPRVVFGSLNTSQPLHDTLNRAKSEVAQSAKSSGDLIVLGRGHDSRISFRAEKLAIVGQTSQAGSDVSHSLGDIAQVLMATEIKASLLVVQAKKDRTSSSV
ncbi:MAG: hypothetical protein Q9179_005401 [Wetmoreana sp. 5 TL-2023]